MTGISASIIEKHKLSASIKQKQTISVSVNELQKISATVSSVQPIAAMIIEKQKVGAQVKQIFHIDQNDCFVKVSENDFLEQYLSEKLVAGDGITLEILNPGGTETLEISAAGETIKSAEADEDILAGQPVSIKSNGHLILGNASDILRTKIVGLATEDCLQTFACKFISGDFLTLADWTNIVGSTELTRGGAYYLDVTNGKLTATAPTVTGNYVLKIGRATAVDTLWIEIEESILL